MFDYLLRVKPARPRMCELCRRRESLTFHHLIPRKVHRKRRYAARYSRSELSRSGIWICRLCHHQVHRFFSETDLADSLSTIEKLRAEPRMARFLTWARKQK